jgi:tungstate transport system ATP-binding protein
MSDPPKRPVRLSDFEEPVTLTGLKQVWQDRTVLNIPKLQLIPGRRYALLGANGSGKTTLLRLITERLSAENGQIGYLPQKPYAFALSVRHNIGLGIPPGLGLSNDEKESLIDTQLAKLNLTDLKAARGNRLSGGEAQRMALARLLVIPRKILLLDEPTSSLDLTSLAQAETALTAYLSKQNTLMVLATHQLSVARRLCDEMIFLDQGLILASGPISGLTNPAADSRLNLFLRYEHGMNSDE